MTRGMIMLGCVGLLCIAGCADNVTQVVVSIDAESSWRSAATELRVVVRGAPSGDAGFESSARDVTLRVGPEEPYQFPVDVTVAPLEGDSGRRWAVDAIARNTQTNVTATVRVRGSYVSGRTLRVSLLLEDACGGVTCASDQTCRAGACVDALFVDASTDAGVDAGADGGVDLGLDGSIPLHCPSPLVRVLNADAGTLNTYEGELGVPYPSPTRVSCSNSHAVGTSCAAQGIPSDICFSARNQGGAAYCRTPCTVQRTDAGVDDGVCAAVHPDSHCVLARGNQNEADRYLCTQPCNAFDDVGCPSGLHCTAIVDTDDGAFYTDCAQLVADPGHDHEPCAIVSGATYPSDTGCAAGYTCGYDAVCSPTRPGGFVCLQVCDPDDVAPRVTCPDGSGCDRLAAGTLNDMAGPIQMGRCGY